MPAWRIHHKVYQLLGLPVKVCQEIDKYIDFGAKTYLGFDLRVHDLGRQTPYILRDISRDVIDKFGVDGFRCFLAHHILDYIEALLKLDYDREFIARKIAEKFAPDFVPDSVKEVARLLVSKIIGNLDAIITIIKEGLGKDKSKTDPRRIALSRLLGVINAVCRIVLVKRGMFSKGFCVQQEYYLKLISRVGRRVYDEVLANVTSDIIKQLDSKLSHKKLSLSLLFELKKDSLLCSIIDKIQKIAEEEANKILSK